jgi:phosphate transport system substrate-binding protein
MKKILIIDKSGDEGKTISSSLVENGYEVMETDNIFRAAAVLGETKFDLILCAQKFFFTKHSPLQAIILEDARHSKIILLQEENDTLPAGWQHPRVIGIIKKPAQLETLLEVISSKVHKTGFTGTVHDIDLTDYLQLLAMNKATKAFVVESESGNGVLVLYQGNLVYASYGELRGELAFHAMVSLPNGRIVDKRLKRMPKPNISKSLSRLLLEANISRDETGISEDGNPDDDFLLDEMGPKESTAHLDMLNADSNLRGGMLQSPLFLGLICLFFFVLAGGAFWNFFPFEKQYNEITVNRQTPVQVAPLVSASWPQVEKEIHLPDVPTSPKNTVTEPPPSLITTQSIILDNENTETIPAIESPHPKLLLRLHGSNTIGAKLIENLAIAYLVQKYHGKAIELVTRDTAEEKLVTCQTDDGPIAIEIHAHGSSTGFKDLLAETCDIGMASRKIKEKEITALAGFGNMTNSSSEHILALDGIAVIIHKSNPLVSLSIDTIARIFSGEITDWGGVTDSKMTGPINVYARDAKSGTYDTFKGVVLKKTPLIDDAKRFESNADLSDTVSRDKLGIGFTGLPYIRQAKAVSVSDQGTIPIFPNFFTVATEDYPLARRLYLYLPQNSDNNIASDFVNFCLETPGQLVVKNSGFIDLGIRQFVAGITIGKQAAQNRVIFQHYVDETKDKKRLSLNFRFHPNSTNLDNRAIRDLERMVEFLKDQSIESVSLIGFADSRGEYQYNTSLAMERSKVVRDELNSRGIPITAVISASEEMPVASNITARGREKNRRVEVWVRINRS